MIFKTKTKIKSITTESTGEIPPSFFLPIYLYIRIPVDAHSEIQLFATELDCTPILPRPITVYNIECTIDSVVCDTELGKIEFLSYYGDVEAIYDGRYEELFHS